MGDILASFFCRYLGLNPKGNLLHIFNVVIFVFLQVMNYNEYIFLSNPPNPGDVCFFENVS